VSKSVDNSKDYTIRVTAAGQGKPSKEYKVTGLKKATRYHREELQKAIRIGSTVNIIDAQGVIVK
jgi:hypothetical protein